MKNVLVFKNEKAKKTREAEQVLLKKAYYDGVEAFRKEHQHDYEDMTIREALYKGFISGLVGGMASTITGVALAALPAPIRVTAQLGAGIAGVFYADHAEEHFAGLRNQKVIKRRIQMAKKAATNEG